MTESEDLEPPLPPSKTRLKQAAHDLQALGARLVELPKERLQGLGLPEALYEAVRECRSITRHEARRRQLQYIGRLMRDIDPANIEAQFSIWDGTSAAEVAFQHSIERWRERLMADDSALTELAAAHPGCDTQQLRTLMRNARREFAQQKPPRSHRELFRMLRSILAPSAAGDAVDGD
jgi:ribosome-associated protein